MKLKYAAFAAIAAFFTTNCFAATQTTIATPAGSARVQVSGSSADGNKQTTIIDANGNLKVVPSANAKVTMPPSPTPRKVIPKSQNPTSIKTNGVN